MATRRGEEYENETPTGFRRLKLYIMILLISDYDNTLADAYWEYGEWNIFRTKTLADTQKATEIYEKYRRWSDDIVVYPELLSQYGIDDPYSFFEEAGLPRQLYDDVVEYLLWLQDRSDITTVILTTGDEDFQRLKTSLTRVDDLVDEVYITRDRDKIAHIRAIHKKYQPDHTIFVDDRIHMTDEDFDFPITILDMDRSRSKNGKDIIHTLSEIEPYIAAIEK